MPFNQQFKWLLSIGLLLPFFALNAQSPVQKGVVLEKDAKGNILPVMGAFVFWQNTNSGVFTNENGIFEIPINNKSNVLIIQATGYLSDTLVITKADYVKVILVSKTKLAEVLVQYERKSSEISFIDPLKVTVMSEKELFKAACCNLSESFETNPSVDVSYTDALTGTKQIQMLGLTGQYTQLSQNAIPGIRGLAQLYGLNYLPGTWIKEIQVSKGVGSVANGYDAITGQINANLHMPDGEDKFYLNLYAGEGGRTEGNLIYNQKVGNKFWMGGMVHISNYALRMDRNNDGFLDNPLGTQLNGNAVFKFNNHKGWIIQGGLRNLSDIKVGGQFNYSHNKSDTSIYGTRIHANRTDGWLKIGHVFKHKAYKSIGLQLSSSGQNFNNYFGRNLFDAMQQNVYANLIYQTIIGNTNHKIRSGLSSNTDIYREHFINNALSVGQTLDLKSDRTEATHGVFAEYTYSYLAKFTLVAGARIDQYNVTFSNAPHYRKYYFTPRLHVRYAFNEKTVLRASAGTGWRPANIVTDNAGVLVSGRLWNFTRKFSANAIAPFTINNYNFISLNPEVGYNLGLNLTRDFNLNYRNGTFGVEYYFSGFMRQWVADKDFLPSELNLFYANNATVAHNFQAQLDYSPVRRLDFRIAYRYFNIQTNYLSGRLQTPLIAPNRGFINVGYKTKSKWDIDVTANYISKKRLPGTTQNPAEFRLPAYSKSFMLFNTQITKSFKKYLAVYVGVENLFNFKQTNPIIDNSNPFSRYFDASMIWGPVFGRMSYAGLRFRL
jgi:outer membrane receptor for ferrienterochelin and colicin